MIINSANKFVENIGWWISFFNIIFWIIALIPLGLFGLFILAEGPPRRGDEFLILMFAVAAYVGACFVIHRLTLLGFHFMKALISSAIDCQNELKQIREELRRNGGDTELNAPTPKPSPYQF